MKLGQKIANKVSTLLATWTFVFWFSFLIVSWITYNLTAIAFDPFPFILLNLFLSCFAALIAPVIMISQKQQEAVQEQQTRTLLHLAEATQIQLKALLEQLTMLKEKPPNST